MEQTTPSPNDDIERGISIADLRTELGITLAEMGQMVGLSKSQMHDVERRNAASLRVAVALEQLAGGRIDAVALCADVLLARHGQTDTAEMAAMSPGKSVDNFPETGKAA
jgi:transcriptional regulator with XRE-family HTH domain